ncbi:UDP-N-acetylmuramoyl-tripeptide--D-alanyl-D-alanine ligase [Psychroserpens jangbogonensis]|uniref:UDP-N-acetylmuramoyl-tripeptide--D-alanyl-D- alanine ligase n=1 Tax=Psychroserpens jangbogonensis TaxID=1484460 RepID=UPI00053D2086|nr:UDP-N-acetylmuramoyl-tripeptide--D-alanyl-D-alanine ligase [Psychroserpens jangbogonensis]
MTIEKLYDTFLKCNSISTDTRKINSDCLFFALKGDNFNGNKFALEALKRGAQFVVIDEEKYNEHSNCILVDNVLETLQGLARHHRQALNTPIIALTGSNGKTTTKELINAVLSTTFKTSATKGNLNNHIGVPLTILEFTKDTEIGIVEMGANHQKEIEFLTNIALPDYGLITNFGKAHLEGFVGIEGVIKGKSELYDHLKTHNKIVFVNYDDVKQIEQIGNYEKTIMFGSNMSMTSAQPFINLKFNSTNIKTHLTGAYNYNNIAAAIAIGTYFKVDDDSISKAITNYIPSNNRSQIIEKNSNKIILDAYNANPTSMIAALNNFGSLNDSGKVAILGDMFELGETAAIEHQSISDYSQKFDIEHIYLVGEHFFKTKNNSNRVSSFKSFEDLKHKLLNSPLKHKYLLIKGSRGMALERVLDYL